MLHLHQCPKCKKYTFQEKCCVETILPRPPKFSLDDKYAGMRRTVKKEDLVEKGFY